MRSRNSVSSWFALLLLGFAMVHMNTSARAENAVDVVYRSIAIEEVEIFYREAGNPDRPTLLLLHGFPTSSHVFRDLIPKLADEYHLIAPD